MSGSRAPSAVFLRLAGVDMRLKLECSDGAGGDRCYGGVVWSTCKYGAAIQGLGGVRVVGRGAGADRRRRAWGVNKRESLHWEQRRWGFGGRGEA